ncbi:hypothetical protein EMCRGX_G026521 [Ephydatia muelleri]
MGKRICRRKYDWCRKKGGTADAKALQKQESVVEHLTISIPLNKVKLSTVDQVMLMKVINLLSYLSTLISGAYQMLRVSGCLKLPSQRTLREYRHIGTASQGFSRLLDEQLMKAAEIDTLELWQKCVILILDEMSIHEDLVYDKHSGELIGYTNLGDINNHLLAFEKSLSDPGPPEIANSMLMFMVQGLFIPLQFPYCQFPCCSVTGDLLFKPIWEAVYRIERCGFQVLGITFDGAPANRRFLKLHNASSSHAITYKVQNKYDPQRFIYFFSDPSHLIKTARNCLASSARHMQLLSESVSKALHLLGGPDAEETANFIALFDKFFDSFNVSNYTEANRHRKPFRQPYRSSDDFRLDWLQNEFLGYLTKWEEHVNGIEGINAKTRKSMLLSPQTLLGLKITVNSIVEMVKYLFSLEGVKSFLSNRISQDPIEKFFGCQRQRLSTNENPNAYEFSKNTETLRVVNSICRPSVHGNCRATATTDTIDLAKERRPLHKRRSHRKTL